MGWVKATLGYKNCRRRRAVLGVALDLLDRAGSGLLAAVCLLFLCPLLFDRSLLLDLPALLWWSRGVAMAALVAVLGMNVLAAAAVFPSQVAGAAVDAMEQAGPDEGLIAFPEQLVESVCLLLPWAALLRPDVIGRQTAVQARRAWQEQIRQAVGRGAFPFFSQLLCRRQILLSEPPAPSA